MCRGSRSIGCSLVSICSTLLTSRQACTGLSTVALRKGEIVLQVFGLFRIVRMWTGEICLDGCDALAARKPVEPEALGLWIVWSNLIRRLQRIVAMAIERIGAVETSQTKIGTEIVRD